MMIISSLIPAAPGDVVHVKLVDEVTETLVQTDDPIFTVAFAIKPVPEIVTAFPPKLEPMFGTTPVTVGGVSS